MPFGVEKRSPSSETVKKLTEAERRAQELDTDRLIFSARGAAAAGRYDHSRTYQEELRKRDKSARPEPTLTVPSSWL